MNLRIWGYSDDVVEIDGVHRESVNCYDQRIVIQVGDEIEGGLLVVMEYGELHAGVWSAKVARIDEDVPIPWPVSITHHEEKCGSDPGDGYSIEVQVACPDGTSVAIDARPASSIPD